MTTAPISIAIDGPSGAGKSTLARALARIFSYVYVDTGALYRAIGLYAFRKNVFYEDERAVLNLLPEIDLQLVYRDGEQRVLLNGEDVSRAIRAHEISDMASGVSAIPGVRAFLLELQREMARTRHVIMDGRDIGTVVLPNAQIKIFLTASAEDRAERRWRELAEKGQQVPFEQVLRDIKERDARDSGRAAAPLKQAEDAVLVDTSGNTLEESLSILTKIIKERLAGVL